MALRACLPDVFSQKIPRASHYPSVGQRIVTAPTSTTKTDAMELRIGALLPTCSPKMENGESGVAKGDESQIGESLSHPASSSNDRVIR